MFPSIGRIVPEVSGPNFLENVRNSPDISKGIFKAGMCKFESSQVSQAVRRSGENALMLAERPANGGLLRISRQSPGSDLRHFPRETADSLWRTLEKLPFSADCGRRPGSISTAGGRGSRFLAFRSQP
jgi:hypothetical protein